MNAPTCPMSGLAVLDRYFLENRARLLDIAAFLDRIDRCADPVAGHTDFRYRAFREALQTVLQTGEGRAAAVQRCLSDVSAEPLESAAGLKGALGAWKGRGDD